MDAPLCAVLSVQANFDEMDKAYTKTTNSFTTESLRLISLFSLPTRHIALK
jgi:hypothetical protein